MASLTNNMAPAFATASAYTANSSIVMKDGRMYMALKDKAAGAAWTADNWQEIFLTDVLRGHMNSNLGGKAPELLWTNPSPTSTFTAQTVSLDLSAYDGVIIEGKSNYQDNDGYGFRVYIKKGETKCGGRLNANNTSGASRKFTVSDSGIDISTAYMGNVTYDTVAIPLKIYGVTAQNVNLGGFSNSVKIDSGSNTSGWTNLSRNALTKNYKSVFVTLCIARNAQSATFSVKVNGTDIDLISESVYGSTTPYVTARTYAYNNAKIGDVIALTCSSSSVVNASFSIYAIE